LTRAIEVRLVAQHTNVAMQPPERLVSCAGEDTFGLAVGPTVSKVELLLDELAARLDERQSRRQRPVFDIYGEVSHDRCTTILSEDTKRADAVARRANHFLFGFEQKSRVGQVWRLFVGPPKLVGRIAFDLQIFPYAKQALLSSSGRG